MRAQHLLFIAFVGCCHAMTYYIDRSCGSVTGGKALNDKAIAEVKHMASIGLAKLNSNDKTLMAAVRTIFIRTKRVKEADVRTKAQGVFDKIARMTATSDRKRSSVRFYCDNDRAGPGHRWQPVPDLPGASDAQKNSKKPFETQQWWDHINKVLRTPGSKGVKDLDTFAETYKLRPTPDKAATEDGENPAREVITIADEAFKSSKLLLSDYTQADIKSIDDMIDLERLLSMTIFHELCHLKQVADMRAGATDAFGWEKIMNQVGKAPFDAPDAYAFLALTALLNDHYGMHLSTVAKDAKDGILVKNVGAASGPVAKRDPLETRTPSPFGKFPRVFIA